jgi:two-component system response regulator YesN
MKPSILIVDDEKVVCEGLANYLSENYLTHTAYNGKDALKVLNENSDIEVILSDLKMPEMDGIELLVSGECHEEGRLRLPDKADRPEQT